MGKKRKRKKYNGEGPTHGDEIQCEARQLFRKKYTYPAGGKWKLPNVSVSEQHDNWKCDDLLQLKTKLNTIKCSLSTYNIDHWQKHTQQCNPAGQIVSGIKHRIAPEMCTQAWCKLYEILARFQLLEAVSETENGECVPLTTVHLCEAPGGFIGAINHYCQSNDISIDDWQWTGVTLNPYNELNTYSDMIDNEKLIYHTIDNWCFGIDNTGNIMSYDNYVALKLRLNQSKRPVHLITADGSIDCQNDPGEQESLTSSLHVCEILCALQLLANYGNLVVKMFTMFECSSVSVIYLLCCLFRKVHVFKPSSSKPGNSELYVVCISYTKPEQQYLDDLMKNFGASISSQPLFRRTDIPDDFMSAHLECCGYFTKHQIDTIQRNIELQTTMTGEEEKHLDRLQICAFDMYINQYRVQRIDWKYFKRLIDNSRMTKGQHITLSNLVKRYFQHTGSFTDRQLWNSLTWQKQLHLTNLYQITPVENILWLKHSFGVVKGTGTPVQLTSGSHITEINSSRFCDPIYLATSNRLLGTYKLAIAQENHRDELCSLSYEVNPGKLELLAHSFCDVIRKSKYSQKSLTVINICDKTMEEHAPFTNEMQEIAKTLPRSDKQHTVYVHEDVRQYTQTIDSALPELDHRHKNKVLTDITTVLQVLKPGDHMVFAFPGISTRFYLGLFYLICDMFKEVTIGCIRDDGLPPYYICAAYFSSQTLHYIKVLADIRSTVMVLNQATTLPNDIVQIVPMNCLYESDFFSLVQEFNSTQLQYRVNAMIDNLSKLSNTEVELTEQEESLKENILTDVKLPQNV